MMRYLYWRIFAFITSRPYPFIIAGHTLYYCWKCFGWGQEPSGCECSACSGQGYAGEAAL